MWAQRMWAAFEHPARNASELDPVHPVRTAREICTRVQRESPREAKPCLQREEHKPTRVHDALQSLTVGSPLDCCRGVLIHLPCMRRLLLECACGRDVMACLMASCVLEVAEACANHGLCCPATASAANTSTCQKHHRACMYMPVPMHDIAMESVTCLASSHGKNQQDTLDCRGARDSRWLKRKEKRSTQHHDVLCVTVQTLLRTLKPASRRTRSRIVVSWFCKLQNLLHWLAQSLSE
jgi:hypothetical protein